MRGLFRRRAAEKQAEAAKPEGLGMARAYLPLHKFLDSRYADTVFLTFADIEALLGFSLPISARHERAWWASGEPDTLAHSNAWLLARRTASPNLAAQTVVFVRA
jgi:hypothetical protein